MPHRSPNVMQGLPASAHLVEMQIERMRRRLTAEAVAEISLIICFYPAVPPLLSGVAALLSGIM
jgi:hypothetical protein